MYFRNLVFSGRGHEAAWGSWKYVLPRQIFLWQYHSADIFIILDSCLFYTDLNRRDRWKLLCRSCCFLEPQQGLPITFQLSCSQSESLPLLLVQCIISFKDWTSLIKVFEERCVCLFSFPGARSVRRYYISSVLQVTTQHKTKSLSGHWCLDGLHSIIHDLFCSGLQ